MIKAWQFIKENAVWLYAAAFIGLAVDAAVAADWTGFWITVGIGLFTLIAMGWLVEATTKVEVVTKDGGSLPPRTFEEGEMKALLSKGYEPVETPTDDPIAEHAADCHICRRFLKEPQ